MQQPQEDQPDEKLRMVGLVSMAIGQISQRLERASPGVGRHERQDALEYEHQRARCEQNVGE